MGGRDFHQRALGTLLSVAGGVLVAQNVTPWSSHWFGVLLQVMTGTAAGIGLARWCHPALGVADSALLAGLGTTVVLGINYPVYAPPPVAVLLMSALTSAVTASGVVYALRRSHIPPAEELARTLYAGTIVWAAYLATTAALNPVCLRVTTMIVGPVVGGAVAVLLVPGGNVRCVSRGFLAGAAILSMAELVRASHGNHTSLGGIILALFALIGFLLVALGAGIAALAKPRPASRGVAGVPPAQIARQANGHAK